MAEIITMPKLGFDMAEGSLNRWILAEGEPVSKGDILAEIETDKATVEVEASASGILLKHLVDEGAIVPIGAPIAVIGKAGEEVDLSGMLQEPDGAAPPAPDAAAEVSSAAPQPAAEPATADAAFPTGVRISPLARKMAEERSIDILRIKGTGPQGRIVKRDIENAHAEPAAMGAVPRVARADRRIPLTKLRRAIGRRMQASKQEVPHFTVTMDIDAEPLLKQRAAINTILPEGEKISVNDLIAKAAALTLLEYPNLNSSLEADSILQHGEINLGVAVAVEDGLLTIVIRAADQKTLRQISMETREMVARARDGRVRPDDIEGSTFTVSNLGMFGVEDFSAIINPPEAAILAVGGVRDVPVISEGSIVAGKRMKVTLSADHRVTDGVEAAQWLQRFKRIIEEPLEILL
ncbi:MAG: 2-oxo acid dehydrogenase subunit E2 [Anaerolineales bacterium]|nr:2-oxo acid dehydrogenase subunit E2 [Anaerolineales bacterium]